MRKVHTLICIACVGFVSFAGSSVHAQPSVDDMILSLAEGGSLSQGSSFTSFVQEITGAMDTSGPIQPPVSVIEAPLSIVAPVPDVNQTAIEIFDTRTGRYPPRLKINFTEFPLKTLSQASRTDHAGIPTTVVTQRIQDRLRVQKIDLVVQDRTATVSGTVETEQQRRLVASMLRFEPGIDVVKNEIVVMP
jgi:hypothetical protein